ncbi:uncharacterized protein LOC131948347 [Physella acuta]|uniref:uncharacterized protein LOC131948347 n=1 Tax=Physella acuta TaxID=109671 RepID=UPI0027DDB5E8|nr:uncharacterized protein LOC131948347 [Physella acuta]
MCCGVGVYCCCWLIIEILPYLCLVILPLIGSFYGSDSIYRTSILLIGHSVIIEYIPEQMLRYIPCLNIMLFGILMVIPLSLMPWPVVWLYSMAIWITEPIFMIAEVFLILNFVMRISQTAADKIEEDEESAHLYKGAILMFSSLSYAFTASVAYSSVYSNATTFQIVILVVILCICVANHNMMLMAHEGIISDCAFTCLINVLILYTMITETQFINSPLPEPLLWKRSGGTSSSGFVQIVASILQINIDYAQIPIDFLKRFFSPLYIVMLAIRLYSILFIVQKVTRNFFQKDDTDSFDCEEETPPPCKSPVLLKVSIIFMFTQLCGNLLQEWSGNHASLFWYLPKMAWTSEFLFNRLIQIVAVNGFYIWRLYRAEDWTWNPWLTP